MEKRLTASNGSEGQETESESDFSLDEDDLDFSGSDSDSVDGYSGDDGKGKGKQNTRNEKKRQLKSKKESVQGRIKSARNWFIVNIVFFLAIIVVFAVLIGLGFIKFDTGFNSSIN